MRWRRPLYAAAALAAFLALAVLLLATTRLGLTAALRLAEAAAGVEITARDGWTVTTRDGRLSAQWEHTIAVTEDGFEERGRVLGRLAAERLTDGRQSEQGPTGDKARVELCAGVGVEGEDRREEKIVALARRPRSMIPGRSVADADQQLIELGIIYD